MALYQSGVEFSQEETAQVTSFLKTLTGEYNGVLLTNENPRDMIHGH
jgi:cytochrome c peroxidase